jgi:hypothetical protein
MTMVTIEQQLACVKREIALRERVYPRFVAEQRLTQEKADAELATMRAVLVTLGTVKDYPPLSSDK